MKLKNIVFLTAMAAAFSSHASTADITVTASVDATAGITQADGSPLKPTMDMAFVPGKGLQDIDQNIKLWSNDPLKGLKVKLASGPELIESGTQTRVPLSVMMDQVTLTTTDHLFAATTLFPNGSVANGSIAMPMKIKTTNASSGIISGNYSGTVSLVITQDSGGGNNP